MKHPDYWLRPAAVAAAGAVLLFASSLAGGAAELQKLTGHVPAAVASGLKPTGFLADTNVLHLAIGLPVRDQAGLDKFLKDLYDPASPNYRHYLSVAQFTEKFGPSKADYEALRAFVQKNSLKETQTSPNRMVLSVDASVADIRRVFNVNIRTYVHPADLISNNPNQHRQFHAPDTEPSLDLSVPVLHISGLDNYELPHPFIHMRPAAERGAHPMGDGTNNGPRNGSGPGGSYVSADFRNAYAPGVILNGAHQNVALLEYDGYYPSDIIAYERVCSLPNIKLVNIPIDGGIFTPDGGEIEVSLDIEMAMAMAPGLSTIFVYESSGGPVDDILSRMATDDLARQISSSWGYDGDPTTDQLYQEFATQGQTFFEASGDTGAFIGSGPFQGIPPTASSPYSGGDPYMVLVSGTQLVMNGLGASYASESVWGTGLYVPGENWGSTGGICTSYSIPVWQQGINMTTNQGSTVYRNSPDVALTGIGIWQNYGDGQTTPDSGGTSAAAPLWAGYNAMINQQAAIYNLPPDGFICPAVYAIAKGPTYNLCFHDITVGNNTWPVFPTNFYAVPGYDLCTGWGTPTGSNLINTLEPPSSVPVLLVVTNVITGGNGNGIIDYDECNNLTFIITNEGVVAATDIQGYLYSTTPGAIVAQSVVSFPNLLPNQGAASTTPFTLSTEPDFICGTPVNLVLVLKCDQNVRTNNVSLASGIIASPDAFSNPSQMIVPEGDFTGIFSPVTVSGLTAAAKITVSVYVSAVYDEGIVMNLISPDGTTVGLSTNNGGLGANYGVGCISASEETTFDDDALIPITLGTAPFIGSFQPQGALSTFILTSGTNLNGVWKLNVIDEFPGDAATLNCWTLTVTPYFCADGGGQCPGSELSLTMTASPNPVLVNSNLVYTLNVSNAGPSSANDVVISQSMPPGLGFITTSNYPVGVTQNGSNVDFTLGTLPVYGAATVSVVTVPIFPGLITSVATVGSTSPNPNPNNNTASVPVLVTLPAADLAVSMSASPPSLLEGGLVTFNIFVTNNGPFTATGVVLTNTLPANANFVSATTSQGSISPGAFLVDLGTLPLGSNAVVTVTVSPTTTGDFTDAAQVGSTNLFETDPVSFNNSATVTVTVGPAANLAVSAVALPLTIVSGANYTNVATVVNNGPSAAQEVVFSETIPNSGSGLNAATFVSSNPTNNVTVTNGVITWNIGNLSNGVGASITNVLKAPTLLAGVKSVTLPATFSVFGQPGSADTNNSVVYLQNVVEPPTVTIVPVSATLISESYQPPNGSINLGETVGVEFYLQNTGNVSTTNLQATLQTGGGIVQASGSPYYGVLTPGGPPVGGLFTFTVTSATNVSTIVATLALTDGSANLGTISYTFYLPVVQTFWNTNLISVPATNFVPYPASGPAGPFASFIQVSNVTGYVSKVTVTVSNLWHTFPTDIGLLVVSAEANAVLMGSNALGNNPATGVTLTFDSTAALLLPKYGPLASGTYVPASFDTDHYFTNAVVYPSTNAVGTNYSTNLASFKGLPANGVWSLFAQDVNEGDYGAISNGWGLTITTITPVNPTNALSSTIVASTNQVMVGGTLTYLLSVTNNGANAITAYLTNSLPAGLEFAGASVPPQSTNEQTNVIYSLGSLSSGAGVTITTTNNAIAPGPQINTISAGVPGAVFNIASNSAATITTVIPLPAGLVVGISVVPNPVATNGTLTYTLTVTNLGPGGALSNAGSFTLAGLTNPAVTQSPNNSTYVITSGLVQFDLGAIAPNQNDTVVIAAAPLPRFATFTNVWSVSTPSTQTSAASNSASVVVTATNLAPDIMAAGATLLMQSALSSGTVTDTVAFTLTNVGTAPTTTNLSARLLSTNGITPITTNQVYYGAIPVAGSTNEQFSFIATGAPGATITNTLALTDGTNVLGNVSFTNLQIPNYSSPGGIIIPEFGPGIPYPSEILVSGLPNLLVSKVTVTLNGFAHTFPHDVNVLLDSPTGQELIVMGHTGGPYTVSNLTLTFDDAATQSLPAGQLFHGTYLPTDYPPADILPGLAPASTAGVLALFNGRNPNGIWSLYVYDDEVGNAGNITGGWSLGLTATNTVNAALLAVGMIHAPDSVVGGDFLTYQISVTNLGPDTATSVVITDTLPSTVRFVGATVAPQGTNAVISNYLGTVVCSLGDMTNGATATATIKVATEAAGTIINNVSVSTASTDLYLAESSAVDTFTVSTMASSLLYATNLPSGLQLTLLGTVGQNYCIQISSNLLTWTSVFTNTAATGSLIYTDSRTNAPLRFYRAILLPQ